MRGLPPGYNPRTDTHGVFVANGAVRGNLGADLRRAWPGVKPGPTNGNTGEGQEPHAQNRRMGLPALRFCDFAVHGEKSGLAKQKRRVGLPNLFRLELGPGVCFHGVRLISKKSVFRLEIWAGGLNFMVRCDLAFSLPTVRCEAISARIYLVPGPA